MSETTPSLVGELLDGRYEVVRELGAGGMGTVWEVRHIESLQSFALKTLRGPIDRPTLERFLREARAGGSLRTRHVVRITDARMGYLHAGQPAPFIVMELLDGASLDVVLARRAKLETGEVIWITRQLGHALGLAHGKGVVHRDLKPANVFVALDDDGEPVVKLGDFGIAKLVGDVGLALEHTDAAPTATGAMLGTPLYMAPEQMRQSGTITPQTDQWALALLVFRLLSGQDYFADVATTTELVLRVVQDPLTPPSTLAPSLPAAFDAWFLRGCDRDPAARFPNVGAQVAALELALGRPAPRAVIEGRPQVPRAPRQMSSAGLLLPVSSTQNQRSAPRTTYLVAVVATLLSVGSAVGLRGLVAREGADGAAGGQPSAAPSSMLAQAPSMATVTLHPAAEPAAAAPSTAAAPVPPASSGLRPPVAPGKASSTTQSRPGASLPASSVTPMTSRSARAGGAARAEAAAPDPRRSRRPPVASSSTASAQAPGGPAAPAARPTKLGHGEPCARSAECASGLCVAEACW